MMHKVKHLFHRGKRKVKRDNENGARRNVIEELFYDFNRSRAQVYKINFFRGIFFGLGSVLGGTIVVALLIWLLSEIVHVFPPLSHFFKDIITTIQSHGN